MRAQQVSTLFRIKSLISSLAIFFIIALSLAVSVGAYASDTIYAHANSAQVIKFTGPGSAGSIFASGLNGPLGLAFDSAGNLYSANFDNAMIYKITPGGAGSLFATGMTYGPVYLAIPEPTSGVIFALGWISLLVLPRVLHSSGR